MAKTPRNAKKKNEGAPAGKRVSDIPLDNIPERPARNSYSPEFKMEAVKRVQAGETGDSVADALGIARSLVHTWAKKVREGKPLTGSTTKGRSSGGGHGHDTQHELANALRTSLVKAQRARDERLEIAACIVEADSMGNAKEIESLAKAIRAFKRPPQS